MKRTYILDTNVFLTNADSIYDFKNHDIVIPLKVLDEIDKHKKRHDGVGLNARSIIRTLDSLRAKGNLHKGVRLGKGKGLVSVRGYDFDDMPVGCNVNSADNQIIATAITERSRNPKRKTIVVTRDINMRVKCDSLEMLTEDYIVDKVVEKREDLFSGFSKVLVDEQVVDRFYANEEIYLEDHISNHTLHPNQYVMLVSSSNEKKTALARYYSETKPLSRIRLDKSGTWGLKPRNKEQEFALDLLLDPSIDILTLIGPAGCGKTLLAIAAGLQGVLDDEQYKRLVVSRPVQPLGKE